MVTMAKPISISMSLPVKLSMVITMLVKYPSNAPAKASDITISENPITPG